MAEREAKRKGGRQRNGGREGLRGERGREGIDARKERCNVREDSRNNKAQCYLQRWQLRRTRRQLQLQQQACVEGLLSFSTCHRGNRSTQTT